MDAITLLEAVRRHVADLGFELVEFKRSGPPQRPAIQVRIDRPDSTPGHGVTTEDCARTARALTGFLEGPAGFGDRYQLEVSSPGIERPVRFPEHWRRYVGRVVRLTARSIAGHPHAVILEVPDDGQVRLRLPDGAETMVALADIKEALLQVDDPAASGRREP
jgi:ribosome maturation factor RimP